MELVNPDIWSKFGLPGMVICALFALVCFLISENRRNQGIYIECMRDMAKMSDTRQEETNKTINALTMVIERSIYTNHNRNNNG